MKMKLTERQQEMYDGKQGEAKKFCMDKLVDFGLAVEATEMVDLFLVLWGVRSGRRTPGIRKHWRNSTPTTWDTAGSMIRYSR